MNNDEMIEIFQQWNLHDNSKTYPVFFNSYRWLSILAECFTSVMHHTSIIIWREKWVNCRSPVLVKIFLCSWKGKSSTGTKNGVHSHCVKKRLNKERKIDVAITWKLSKINAYLSECFHTVFWCKSLYQAETVHDKIQLHALKEITLYRPKAI